MSTNNIKVAIKARPILKREKDYNLCWKISKNTIQLTENQGEPFYFDHIFDQNSTNENIFDIVIKPIVNSSMEGINGTIFAYGQTSSGKTYTMLGDGENPGVVFLTIQEIFKFIQKSTDRLYLLRVGYIEIYNEKIYDLLNRKNKDLKIHETANGEVSVNCSEFIVTSEIDIFQYLQAGNKLRKCGETNMNERSSRSHAIFKITIESREVEKNEGFGSEAFQISSLNLVDLAGSERANQTGATGSRLKEGGHINKSLLSLGCVIKSLSESSESDSFINYRNSKLTRILQASLGGNALTAIICNIKLTTVEETHSTLSFAMRARKIKNKPHVNEVLSEAAMMKILEKKVNKLQCELELERKKNSGFKVLELEKKIKAETHKIVSSRLIKSNNIECNRRRTWCPSSFLKEKEKPILKPKDHFNQQNNGIATKISNNLSNTSSFVTIRNEINCDQIKANKHKDLFLENLSSSNNLFDTQRICMKCTKNSKIYEKNFERDLKFLNLSNKYKILEKNYNELVEFTTIEKNLNVHYDTENLLNEKPSAYPSELVFKNDEISKLKHDYILMEELHTNLNSEIQKLKEQINEKNDRIIELEKIGFEKNKQTILEHRDKISVECEFEQFKLKSKVREYELLDLIKEMENTLGDKQIECKNSINASESKNLENFFEYPDSIDKKFNNSKNRKVHNYFIIIMENNNIMLYKQCKRLFFVLEQTERTFHEIETQLQNCRSDCLNKETQIKGLILSCKLLNQKIEELEKENQCLKSKFKFCEIQNMKKEEEFINNLETVTLIKQECANLKVLIYNVIRNTRNFGFEQRVFAKKFIEKIQSKSQLDNKIGTENFYLSQKNLKNNRFEAENNILAIKKDYVNIAEKMLEDELNIFENISGCQSDLKNQHETNTKKIFDLNKDKVLFNNLVHVNGEYDKLKNEHQALVANIGVYVRDIQLLSNQKKSIECELQVTKEFTKILEDKLNETAKEIKYLSKQNQLLKAESHSATKMLHDLKTDSKLSIEHINSGIENNIKTKVKSSNELIKTINKENQNVIDEQFIESRYELKIKLEICKKKFPSEFLQFNAGKEIEKQLTLTSSALNFCYKELESRETNSSYDTKIKEYKHILKNFLSQLKDLKISNQILLEGMEMQNEFEKQRKLRRQSCQDETRFCFVDSLKEVGTMTDPSDENCNCTILADKISKLKRFLIIKESQITALTLKESNNEIRENFQILKKRSLFQESENKKLNDEICKLNMQIEKLICKNYVTNEKETQTDERIENDVKYLKSVNQDLRKLCRYRYSKISQLEKQIEIMKNKSSY